MHLRNPTTVSTKVFEWTEDDNGILCQQAIPMRMCKDILHLYPGKTYYDAIENEYNCCDEYDSSEPGRPPVDDDDLFWDGNNVVMNKADDDRILSAQIPSPDVEISDSWNNSVEAPNPLSPDNFIAEVHCILFFYFGYTPVIPVPTFSNPVLETGTERWRFTQFLGIPWKDHLNPAFETSQISATATFFKHLCTEGPSIPADEWDLSRNSRQSFFFPTHLKAIRHVGQGFLCLISKTVALCYGN